jgi:hypothetical protein
MRGTVSFRVKPYNSTFPLQPGPAAKNAFLPVPNRPAMDQRREPFPGSARSPAPLTARTQLASEGLASVLYCTPKHDRLACRPPR